MELKKLLELELGATGSYWPWGGRERELARGCLREEWRRRERFKKEHVTRAQKKRI